MAQQVGFCPISGHSIIISDFELALRERRGLPMPRYAPEVRIRKLASFWHSFALHKRKSDASGRELISVFSAQCPYPVWHREEWLAHGSPDGTPYDISKPFFPQLWEVFRRCPIPHNVGLGSENCEYADDAWNSKNCYLCHSLLECQDCQYCYRILRCKDCRSCVFCFDSELCFEVVQGDRCFNLTMAIDCRQCHDSAFLFDCRNCAHCFMCSNLRNQSYCIRNQACSKQEYEAQMARINLSSQSTYLLLREEFEAQVHNKALWKCVDQERCENCQGTYLKECRDCENCFFISESRDCINCTRGIGIMDSIDCLGCGGELLSNCCSAWDGAREVSNSFNITASQDLEYCAFCFRCTHCFGCCGLINKSYCIFNVQYSPAEYQAMLTQIREKLDRTGIRGEFFPAYFSPCCYEESLAHFFFPLSRVEQQTLGFRVEDDAPLPEVEGLAYQPSADTPFVTDDSICSTLFWDPVIEKRYQVTKQDLEICRARKLPLPGKHYLRRIKELYGWMYYSPVERETICAISKQPTRTFLPRSFEGRIVSAESYAGM